MMALEGSATEEDIAEQDIVDEDEEYAVLAARQAGHRRRGNWADSRRVNRDGRTSRGFREVRGAGGGGSGSSYNKDDAQKRVDDLKRRTRCHNCGKRGHFKRECREPKRDGRPDRAGPSRRVSAHAVFEDAAEDDDIEDLETAYDAEYNENSRDFEGFERLEEDDFKNAYNMWGETTTAATPTDATGAGTTCSRA